MNNRYIKIISFLFFILLLSIELIPNIGAVDKIGPQWLFLSLLNSLIILYNTYYIFFDFKTLLNSKIFLSYFGFVIICTLSIFFAINKVESLNYFSRIIIIFFTFINFLILQKKINLNAIPWVLVILLTIESLSIFNQFLELYDPNSEFGRNSKLIGVAANINIAGFSIALLLPFAIQLLIKSKNLVKLILIAIISISSFSAFLTGSRGATLSVTLIFIGYIIRTILLKSDIRQKLNTSILIIVPLLISIVTTEILFESMRYTYRMNQIVERGSNSRLKYYEDTFESFKENPIIGIGIGNWKLNSIEKGKRHIEGYIVPYHAHNDFLQLLAETGILGLISYISIFLFSFLGLLKLKKPNNNSILFSCLMFLCVYLLDANLNFPIARPIMQIKLALILAILVKNEK